MESDIMPTLTLTSKRQATFPRETCRELGLQPGDTVELEAREVEGGREWILRPQPARSRRWLGSLGRFAAGVNDHSLVAIRASIASGRKRAAG
jgi:bifunctional DNA-binding transcriptional regulator/antitoxin component of YhaV-PrlF toxin-antitoxin module